MLIGYARVSTQEQNLDLQLEALKKAGCEKIFTDKASGKNSEREGLQEAFKIFRKDDVLIVWKLDRLGRSVRHLVNLLDELNAASVYVRSLTEGIDTQGAMGKVIYQLVAIFSELERTNIIERTRAGLAAARAQGRIGGRPRAINDEMKTRISQLIGSGWKAGEVIKTCNISKSTYYKYFPANR